MDQEFFLEFFHSALRIEADCGGTEKRSRPLCIDLLASQAQAFPGELEPFECFINFLFFDVAKCRWKFIFDVVLWDGFEDFVHSESDRLEGAFEEPVSSPGPASLV